MKRLVSCSVRSTGLKGIRHRFCYKGVFVIAPSPEMRVLQMSAKASYGNAGQARPACLISNETIAVRACLIDGRHEQVRVRCRFDEPGDLDI